MWLALSKVHDKTSHDFVIGTIIYEIIQAFKMAYLYCDYFSMKEEDECRAVCQEFVH